VVAHPTIWLNPPNKELYNHSELPVTSNHCSSVSILSVDSLPSTIHHHYPLGINPQVLCSNPMLAKMLSTTSACSAMLLPDPLSTSTFHFLSPFFPRISHLVPQQLNPSVNNCSSKAAAVVEELRVDPLRKVSPPNKVVLSNSTVDGDALTTKNH